jgi:hypothetical protein
VLLYVLGVAIASCVAVARATSSAHPAASWWLYYTSVALALVTICIALANRWCQFKVTIFTIASLCIFAAGGLFWRYRPLQSTAPPVAAVESTHVHSDQESSPPPQSQGPAPTIGGAVKPIPATKSRERRSTSGTVSNLGPEKSQTPTQSCPNGICIGGNNSGDPTVINMAPPLPTISWTVRELPAVGGKNPAVNVDFSADGAFSSPAFAAECTRPCESESGGLSTGGRMFMPQTGWDDSNPSIAILAFQIPNIIRKGEPLHWVIRSKDNQQVVIKSVQAIRF